MQLSAASTLAPPPTQKILRKIAEVVKNPTILHVNKNAITFETCRTLVFLSYSSRRERSEGSSGRQLQ